MFENTHSLECTDFDSHLVSKQRYRNSRKIFVYKLQGWPGNGQNEQQRRTGDDIPVVPLYRQTPLKCRGTLRLYCKTSQCPEISKLRGLEVTGGENDSAVSASGGPQPAGQQST